MPPECFRKTDRFSARVGSLEQLPTFRVKFIFIGFKRNMFTQKNADVFSILLSSLHKYIFFMFISLTFRFTKEKNNKNKHTHTHQLETKLFIPPLL